MTTPLPHYVPLEKLEVRRPVDRIRHLAALSAGRVVLDLGAMDETAYGAKQGTGRWLHEELSKTAKRVVGIDSSALIPPEGISTFENARIERGSVVNLGEWLARSSDHPEIIVAGELIEHLENPLEFLRSIKEDARFGGATLLISTPNATAVHNCLIATLGRESTHHDHLAIFSYKTLCTLMHRAGFREWTIVPYLASFPEMKSRNGGLRRFLVCLGERMINGVEWCFPLMSFGYIVIAKV